jgi:ABC-type glycerol-3-phosphate transport system substrate-binding protein
MKKIALLVVTVLLGSTLLFAGGGQAGSAPADGLTVIKAWGLDKQYALDNRSISFSEWVNGSVDSRIFKTFNEDMAKRGIKVEFELVMVDQIGTAFQTLLASGQLNNYDWIAPVGPDIKTRYNLINQNALYPINQAIQQYSTGTAKDFFNTAAGRQLAKLNTVADGNFYWLTQNYNVYAESPDNPWGEPVASNIRKDWLDKLGLPVPQTLDEFYNTLVAFQENDANGNGVKDEVADISISGIGSIAQWFGLANENIVGPLDGKAVSPWYQTYIKEYFAYMNKLYKAGLINIGDSGGSNVGNIVIENRASFYGGYMADTWTPPTIVTPPGAPKPYYLPIVIQAYPDVKPRVVNEGGVIQWMGSGMYSIPARSKNIQKTTEMIDYFFSQEYRDMNEYGIPGYTYNIDANGEVTRINVNNNNVGVDQQLYFQTLVALYSGWQGIFPRMRHYDIVPGKKNQMIEMGQLMGYSNGYIEAYEMIEKAWAGTWPLIPIADGVLAFPTNAESDRINELNPDLSTYASELITALVMGEKSLSNWDSYIVDLKRLGLDEVIAIYQARLDRAK